MERLDTLDSFDFAEAKLVGLGIILVIVDRELVLACDGTWTRCSDTRRRLSLMGMGRSNRSNYFLALEVVLGH
jgi:hypothetical protein